MSIPLTKFLDFVNSTGTKKRDIVLESVSPEEYAPYKDFYKELREAIISLHKNNKSVDTLTDILLSTAEIKKKNYNELISGYQKWAKNKRISFIEEKSTLFSIGGIELSINPELIISINKKPTVVKLYFKQDKLEKPAADMITVLMSMAFRAIFENYDTYDFAVLDIRLGRLWRITKKTPIDKIKDVLVHEAESWYNYQN